MTASDTCKKTTGTPGEGLDIKALEEQLGVLVESCRVNKGAMKELEYNVIVEDHS